MTKERRLRALDRQVRRLEARLVHLGRTSTRYTWIRLAVAAGGLLAAGLAWELAGPILAVACLLVWGGLFGLAVYFHRRVEEGIARHRTWRQIKLAHLARARLEWDQIPTGFPQRVRPDHAFETDLDLVGRRSLHRLLDTAVSAEGSQRLRDWLTASIPDAGQIARRQALVRELVPRSLFRDKLALNATVAAGATKTWEADHLVHWLERHTPQASLRRWLFLLGLLAGLNGGLLVLNLLGLSPPLWQISFALYLGLTLLLSRSTAAAWDEALALSDALRQLRAVFCQLEATSYQAIPRLGALCQPFLDPVHRPSTYLARITRVVAAMGVRGNPLLWFALNAAVPWDLFFAERLNRTKAALAHRAPGWIDIWFELEALGSLANLAYLNPDYTFPNLLHGDNRQSAVVFEATGLGHPLIRDQDKVCNDFSVAALGQVVVISGSNMAGKSVFLKTVGVNLALAYGGGPVNARSLSSVLFRLFCSMGVSDSVTDGISYFYAEVKRLKALLAELERDHPLPLLYCIDEIFRGTNNRERLVGSRAYVRALAGQRGVGLIATHDLELTRLADGMPQVVNLHFRDQVVADRMVFDYVLRPGPCPTTNALKIMELEGLPLAPEEVTR